LHLARIRTCHTINNVTFCFESVVFFIVPVIKYRISCKLDILYISVLQVSI
jgi:hypothetical protein